MKYLFITLFSFSLFLLFACNNASKNDEYLEEEEHLENKDHMELVDPDSISNN